MKRGKYIFDIGAKQFLTKLVTMTHEGAKDFNMHIENFRYIVEKW